MKNRIRTRLCVCADRVRTLLRHEVRATAKKPVVPAFLGQAGIWFGHFLQQSGGGEGGSAQMEIVHGKNHYCWGCGEGLTYTSLGYTK